VRELRFRDGRRLWCHPARNRESIGCVFVVGEYAPILGRLPDPGAVRLVWDVGGNAGSFVVWAAPHFPGARFVSFEPCPETAAILERTRAANPGIAWEVHAFGLAGADAEVEGRIPDGALGNTSRHATAGEAVRLTLRDINTVWRAQGCPRLDVLKVDCEGDEHEIFEHAADALIAATHFIVLEVHPVAGRDPERLRRRLESAGFTVDWPAALPDVALAWRPGP
jgi:FkbM family methyltransferase